VGSVGHHAPLGGVDEPTEALREPPDAPRVDTISSFISHEKAKN
jgi:hypothetical protein